MPSLAWIQCLEVNSDSPLVGPTPLSQRGPRNISSRISVSILGRCLGVVLRNPGRELPATARGNPHEMTTSSFGLDGLKNAQDNV